MISITTIFTKILAHSVGGWFCVCVCVGGGGVGVSGIV